jgi:putative SOS response-associated peptidase YedK
MCYHKEQKQTVRQLGDYYGATYSKDLEEMYTPYFHENAFDHDATPLVTAHRPKELRLYNWGLIPFWVKDLSSATKVRVTTLNCISEEMFEKPAFKDVAKAGQRCLIPGTGFYEWRWLNPDDKKSAK